VRAPGFSGRARHGVDEADPDTLTLRQSIQGDEFTFVTRRCGTWPWLPGAFGDHR
jgi:hypothetical protein